MRWTAHGGSLADTLGEDDQCAAYWLYPLARVDGQLSANSSVTPSPAQVVPGGTSLITVSLHDGTAPRAGHTVRGWIEVTGGAATGSLSAGGAYPTAPFTDQGDGTYTAILATGPGVGGLRLYVKVNCCDTAVPVPPEACDPFSVTATVRVVGPEIFADDFDSGNTGRWDTSIP